MFVSQLEVRDRVFRAEIKKPNKADKIRRKDLQKQFDQFKKPTKLELYEASLLSVRDENGHKIKFGSLFEDKKTIVCFIRHFWYVPLTSLGCTLFYTAPS
jgi:hypothetical protein